jgi:hypothetical protein
VEGLVGPDDDDVKGMVVLYAAFIKGLKLGIEYVLGDEEDDWDSYIELDLFLVSFRLVFHK